MNTVLETIGNETAVNSIPLVRRIVICALPGPAGGWLANACLLLLASESEDEVWTGWAHHLPGDCWPEGPAIVRVHDYAMSLAEEATHIISSPRDLRDALLAMNRTFDLPLTEETLRELMEPTLHWASKSGCEVSYESLVADPQAQLRGLADYLGVPEVPLEVILPVLTAELSPDRADAAQRSVALPGEWRQCLPASVVAMVATHYWWWLEDKGYEVNRPKPDDGASVASSEPKRPGVIRGFEADYDKLNLLRQLGFIPTSVLDVGASNGPWSHTCARVFPDATYYLVEALPQLHSKPIQPHDGKQWHIFPVALGASEGEVVMSVPKDRYGVYGASALSFTGGKETDAVKVPLTTIDVLVAAERMAVPDLVKLDVQGFELEVVSGGNCLWGRTEIFIIETSLYRFWPGAPLVLDVMKYFDEHGYTLFDYVGEFRGSNPGKLDQIDLMFVNRSGALARQLNLHTS